MAKGYWIASSEIVDMEKMQLYRQANQAAMKRHGAKFLVVGGQQTPVEGQPRSRQIIVEFESYAAAIAAYEDPEYQEAAVFRKGAATGDFVIVEGFEMPAPK